MKVSKWWERVFGTPLFEPLVAFSYLFPLLYLVMFLIVPVISMLLIAFTYDGNISFHWFKSILMDSYYIQFPPHGDFAQKLTTASGESLYLIRGLDLVLFLIPLLLRH